MNTNLWLAIVWIVGLVAALCNWISGQAATWTEVFLLLTALILKCLLDYAEDIIDKK
jgi:cobalamin biosynthesis protein CobD/CbiB